MRHNQLRPEHVIDKILEFIREAFVKDSVKKVSLSGSRKVRTRLNTETNLSMHHSYKPSTSDSFYNC